jgi:hypothetical protein
MGRRLSRRPCIGLGGLRNGDRRNDVRGRHLQSAHPLHELACHPLMVDDPPTGRRGIYRWRPSAEERGRPGMRGRGTRAASTRCHRLSASRAPSGGRGSVATPRVRQTPTRQGLSALSRSRRTTPSAPTRKRIQVAVGQRKIQTTYDTYGHLLPGAEDELRHRMNDYLANSAEKARQAASLTNGAPNLPLRLPGRRSRKCNKRL